MLYKAGAVLLAALAGWSFGSATPGWEIDRGNEDTYDYPRYGGWGYGGWGYGGWGYGHGAGCATLGMSLFRGTGMTVAWIIGALALAAYGWDGLFFNLRDEEINLAPWGILALSALTGYIYARATDKGPVGPLE